jgi:2-amino-4-hydroxy-6-hydroxymethyldihydropteridine diphosphokinase
MSNSLFADHAFIALGANLPHGSEHPATTLHAVIPHLQKLSKLPLQVSPFYASEPKDCPPGSPVYSNAVVALMPQVDETAESLLEKLQQLEQQFGRVRSGIVNEARTLDLDLLSFRDEIRNTPFLILPHPRAHQRRFVLEPWLAIAGSGYLLAGRTLADWLDECQDPPLCCTSPEDMTAFNRECFCLSLDEGALSQALEAELGTPGLYQLTREHCPYLFSAQPVFVADNHIQHMNAVIGAVEAVVNSKPWRERVLDAAAPITRHDPGGAKGVFMGYDFHVGAESVALIEINTNAGGALLNAVLARAQRACCPEVADLIPTATTAHQLEQDIVAMFLREWQLSNRDRPLQTIAIVDENPIEQYLYPEFILFQQLFRRSDIDAVIVGPEQLQYRDGVLWAGSMAVNLVYNRLTDFLLEHAQVSAIRDAYLANAVVLTPHPQAHALYADKRNLALLTDPAELKAMQVPENIQQILLQGIPRTEVVELAHADRLWSERKRLFFKPASGYGSKAAWRGDKITKRVWSEILAGDYVAQSIIPPAERLAQGDVAPLVFKYDLRNYVYDGSVQWVAARLYQGQTTNFRTPGGGFAPVYYNHGSQAG